MLEEMMPEEVKNLFLEDLLKDNFTYTNHRFSLRYKYRKKRILNNFSNSNRQKYSESRDFKSEQVRIPMKYVLLIVVLLILTILGFTIYRNYSGFFVREYDAFSVMFADNAENAPKVLMEKFYIDMDLSDYEQEVVEDNEICYWIDYKLNEETQLSVMQEIITDSDIRINTENAIIMPTKVTVNDWSGIYCQPYDGAHLYIFNCGDYLIYFSGYLDKNKMENLVKATKFQ